MITLNTNNFGGAAFTLKDYQSTKICILNGIITVDPTTPEYLAAERLELDLPADFAIIKSAMSSAILFSAMPIYHNGTVLRCWIENGKLIIEKLIEWDSYGTYQIYLNSAFVTRGYRGTFTDTVKSNITLTDSTKYDFYQWQFVMTDYYVYFAATFDKFPSTYPAGQGPFTMGMTGFPTDIIAQVPIIVTTAAYTPGQKGSALIIGTFENGAMTFDYPSGATNLGGDRTFFNFFAVRDVE